jgi:hypothetical protein
MAGRGTRPGVVISRLLRRLRQRMEEGAMVGVATVAVKGDMEEREGTVMLVEVVDMAEADTEELGPTRPRRTRTVRPASLTHLFAFTPYHSCSDC